MARVAMLCSQRLQRHAPRASCRYRCRHVDDMLIRMRVYPTHRMVQTTTKPTLIVRWTARLTACEVHAHTSRPAQAQIHLVDESALYHPVIHSRRRMGCIGPWTRSLRSSWCDKTRTKARAMPCKLEFAVPILSGAMPSPYRQAARGTGTDG